MYTSVFEGSFLVERPDKPRPGNPLLQKSSEITEKFDFNITMRELRFFTSCSTLIEFNPLFQY